MASDVDICNLALANIGQRGDVISLIPPDGGAFATFCARFYPMARDAALEWHPWGFATVRQILARIPRDNMPAAWSFAFALPSDCLRALAVVAEGAGDANPLPYIIEGGVLYCNSDAATLRYVAYIEDTSRFSPLFVRALAWMLAADLLGPVIKGDARLRDYCEKNAQRFLLQAARSDASAQKIEPLHMPQWLSGR